LPSSEASARFTSASRQRSFTSPTSTAVESSAHRAMTSISASLPPSRRPHYIFTPRRRFCREHLRCHRSSRPRRRDIAAGSRPMPPVPKRANTLGSRS
jgi:hypothetical protein